MKKYMAVFLVLVLFVVLSAVNVTAYTLPKGMAVTFEEGVSLGKIAATEVFGFVGDADLNQKLNIRDATLIQKVLAKLAELDSQAQRLADVDFSGEVNVKDATSIQKWLAGFETEAPVYHALYSTNDEAQIESVAGKWKGVVNIAGEINAQLKASGKDPGFEFDMVGVGVFLHWNDDMTYSFGYDESSFDQSFEQFLDNYENGMTEYIEKHIKDNKLDTTVEDIVKTSGFESMRKLAEAAVDEDMLRSFINIENSEGKYEVFEDEIYLSFSLQEEPQENTKISYEYYDVKFVITSDNSLVSDNSYFVSFERIQ